jgi:hypothetical protein
MSPFCPLFVRVGWMSPFVPFVPICSICSRGIGR